MRDRPYSWIFAAVVVLVGLSIVLTGSAAAQSTDFVDINADDLEGSGTDADPYIITNASELQAVEDDVSANYSLGNDIDAEETITWNGGDGFDPIVDFNGTLDGNNHSITGLTIIRPSQDDVGLIGTTGTGSIIREISLRESTVNGSSSVGMIVGENSGSLRNVTATGDVNGSVEEIGGIVGRNTGEISNAKAAASVSGSESVGGLVGGNYAFASGTIESVKATGNVTGFEYVGGLVGFNSNTIQHAMATGAVNGSDLVGGLVGWNTDGAYIQNVTAKGEVDGSYSVGGLVGSAGGTIQRAVASGDVNGSNVIGGLSGSNDGLIQNATAAGNVDGSKHTVGGLTGSNNGKIRVATAVGEVTGQRIVGGLVGANEKLVQNATATGSVTASKEVGGLIGQNQATVQDSFAVGSVTGSTSVGGLVGAEYDGLGGVTKDSYWDTQATGQSTSAGNATGLSTDQMTGEAAKTNMSTLNFETVWRAQANYYPVLNTPSVSADVRLSNVQINPIEVSAESTSTHTITFDARYVSTDGEPDYINLTFPDKVTLEEGLNATIANSPVDAKINTSQQSLQITVNPTGGRSIRTLTVVANARLSGKK